MIKLIASTLSLLWILMVGAPQTGKARLHKKPTKEDYQRNLNCWIQQNFYIIALATIVILLITFIFVCFWICGVSAVESGNYYYQFNRTI